MTAAHLQRYIRFLETMTAENVAGLGEVMSADVRFVDPFNDVSGLANTIAIFRHMFDSLDDVRFHVTRVGIDVREANVGLISWDLDAQFRGRPYRVSGMSELNLDEKGLITLHVDHWDSGRQFYEHLPLLGWLLKRIRRRLKVS